MALLDEIADKLAAVGLGTVNTDIFVGSMPEDPNICISVNEYSGSAPLHGFGTPGIKHEFPSVQVLVRGEPFDYIGPKTRATTAWAELAKVQAQALGSTFYLMIRPNQSPFILRRDETKRVVIACNYTCEKEP